MAQPLEIPAPPPPPARPTEVSRPLSALEPGSVGIVERVDTTTPVGQRLLDLGFVPDTRVVVLRRAPLGDPVEYELRGSRMCLRRGEAARIHVRAP